MSRPQTQQSDATPSRSRNAVKESSLCKFPFSDGRRCRMLRHPAHSSLCPFHARAEFQLRESCSLGTELSTTISGDFMTVTDVNHVLGKLFTAVAQDRIPARNAANLAYIGQLLLHSIPGVKSEFNFSYTFDKWLEMDENAKQLSPPPAFSGVTHDSAASGNSLEGDVSISAANTSAEAIRKSLGETRELNSSPATSEQSK